MTISIYQHMAISCFRETKIHAIPLLRDYYITESKERTGYELTLFWVWD